MSESIIFNGIKFYRNPDSKRREVREYYTSGTDGGRKRLHVAIWESVHGPVPEGHVIHHVNGDTLDNSLGNLVCITHAEHMALHHKGRKRTFTPEHIANIQNSKRTQEWSDKVAQLNKERWAKAKESPMKSRCPVCGELFEHVQKQAVYCSHRCYIRQYRQFHRARMKEAT